MGEFSEYITGKLEIQVDKKLLKLDMNMEDKVELKSHIGIIGENDNSKTRKDKLLSLDTTVFNLIKKSYPEEKEENLKAFYFKYSDDIFSALLDKLGWSKKDKEEKN